MDSYVVKKYWLYQKEVLFLLTLLIYSLFRHYLFIFVWSWKVCCSQDFTQYRAQTDGLKSQWPAFQRCPTWGWIDVNESFFLSSFCLELWAITFCFVLYFNSSAIYYILIRRKVGKMLHVYLRLYFKQCPVKGLKHCVLSFI